MFRLIGFLVVLAMGVAGGWFLRGHFDAGGRVAAAESAQWATVDAAGASRAARQISSLSAGSRQFIAVTPNDFAAYVLDLESNKVPSYITALRANAEGERLVLRCMVNLREMGAGIALGAMTQLLGESEELRLSGTLHVLRPGIAEFRVTEARIGSLPVPSPLIPALIGRFGDSARPDGVAANALPLVVPEHVQDLRLVDGKILVYRRSR